MKFQVVFFKNNQDYFDKFGFENMNILEKKIYFMDVLTALTIGLKSFLLELLADIYSNFFSSIKYLYDYIILINFVLFFVTIILIKKILAVYLPNIPNDIAYLLILNIFSLPLFCVYFLSFYKEPYILLSFVLIIFNYVNFFKKNIKFKDIIFLFTLTLFSFLLINYVKYEYILILFLSFSMSIVLANLYIKKLNFFFISFLQFLIIYIYVFNPIPPINLDFFDRLNKNSEEKQIVTKDLNINDDTLTVSKKNTIKEFNYQKKVDFYFPEDMSDHREGQKFSYLYCYEVINFSLCRLINNFSYKISSIKKSTYYENLDLSGNEKEHIINNFTYKSVSSVLLQIPISFFKSFFMPFTLSKSFLIILISSFNLIIGIGICYIIVNSINQRDSKKLFLFLGFVLIFSPLLLAIELVTSNFFTYVRYVFPFNIFLFLILISFFLSKFIHED